MPNKITLKKIAIAIISLFLFAVLLCLCSCGKDDGRFITVNRGFYGSVRVDTQTGVEYIEKNGWYVQLLDSYGNPLIYPGFDAREDRP